MHNLEGGFMLKVLSLICFMLPSLAFGEDISLTVEEYDVVRQKASILVVDSSQVPLNTVLRVHSKTGTCEVKITEKVSDHLIGETRGCNESTITPGMKLAYSPVQTWERPATTMEPYREPTEISTSYDSEDTMRMILDRTTFYMGHNFATQLEGNVGTRNNSSISNLEGDSSLSLGIKGRFYDFTPKFSIAGELGYESPRTLDKGTYTSATGSNEQGTIGFSPRLVLWHVAVLGQFAVMDRMNAFGGINISLPSVDHAPFSLSGDLGFQAGANYRIIPNVAVEGLVKIMNMNLRNNLGQTNDVSLAGLELRGRYFF